MKPRRPVGDFFKLLITAIVFIVVPLSILAQPTGGGPGTNPPPVPISGIEILLAAGAAFGAKKAYDIFRRRSR